MSRSRKILCVECPAVARDLGHAFAKVGLTSEISSVSLVDFVKIVDIEQYICILCTSSEVAPKLGTQPIAIYTISDPSKEHLSKIAKNFKSLWR